MEFDLVFLYTALAVGILTIWNILKNGNDWFYTIKFSSNKYRFPPGDMGLPFIGNMIFLFKCFKNVGNPGPFVSYFVNRFGQGGMYKSFMFGSPSIIVTKPEIMRKIFMDDENFDRGKLEIKIEGQEPVAEMSNEEDRQLRRITTTHIRSQGSVSYYFDCINEIVKNSLEKFAAIEEPFVLFSEMKKPAFEMLMLILIGGNQVVDQELLDVVFKENSFLIRGFHGLPINLPGFAYNRAMKAKKVIVKMFQQILHDRKVMIAENKPRPMANMLDMMLESKDDEGKGLPDEIIVKLLVQYTFAGYESVAKVSSKTIMHLQNHPEFLQKAREEQEDIVKRRPSSNAGLNFDEIRQMKFLTKVLDETLRINALIPFFRVAKDTINLNGYTIPKGWMFLSFLWTFNMDPNTFVNPMEFNPLRWDDFETKPSSYFPFGVGPKMCPGSNVARLGISIILHYFLLYYRLEQINPEKKIQPAENSIVRFKKL